MKHGLQTMEKLGPLSHGHRESDQQPSRVGNQIGPDQKGQILDGAQPPPKPT